MTYPNNMRLFRMKVDLPFLPKGAVYAVDDDLAWVYRVDDDGQIGEYALRKGLAGYLCLLMTEPKYMKKLEANSHE
jgi:hypothetical protein